jgi:hypothetical protein
MGDKKHKKVEIKQKKQKELFVEQLKKTPIVQIVCERLDIGRSTFYRWERQDKKFAEECSKAILEGNYLISDLAESQLVSAIKDKNLSAITFWLKTHHPTYSPKLEVTNRNHESDKLTPEQEKSIRHALIMAALINPNKKEKK